MKPRISLVWQRVHTSYWFYPSLLLAAGAGAAFALTAVDERLGSSFGAMSLMGIYSGGADGARAMLGAIATAVLGVAGTVFSITVAVLSLTTSQFGPRLLRNFMRDTGNQVVLGTFIATFLYCVLVMRTVRSADESPFVPHVSVSVGVGLAVLSVAMLVYFIHHMVTNIQAANFIAATGAELLAAVERLYPDQIGRAAPRAPGPSFRPAARPVALKARRSGYVQAYDGEALLALSRDSGAPVELLREPGTFVAAGTPLARLHGGAQDADEAGRRLDGATSLGPEATEVQDVTMPLNQLTEISMRALSPGVNDPNTALMCVDRLSAGLCALVARRFPSPCREDDDGPALVIATAPTFADLAHLAFDPLRHYGRHDLRVLRRLLDALEDIASCGEDPERHAALAHIADQVLEAGRLALPLDDEKRTLAERQREVKRAIARGARAEEAAPRAAQGGG